MKMIIDTNIFLDVLGNREPFFKESQDVLYLCENKKIDGFITASTVTDLFYLIYKCFHDTDVSYRAIGYILEIVKVINVTNFDVIEAFEKKAPDFEDCLLAVCGINNSLDGIVTRNKRDFSDFGINVFSPEELLEIIG